MEQTGPARDGPSERSLVLGAAAVMVAAQLGLRAWALYPSWFYADDYRLLAQARDSGFSWAYLLTPYDSQFMPLGRAAAALVQHSGGADWGVAATLTLLTVALVDLAAVWMLVTAFGARRGVLLPLGLYLTSAIPLAGGMWWAAVLNQLPLHLALFGAVAAWLHYLRSRRLGWLMVTFLFLALGLAGYVKTALVFGVLAYLLIAYFTSGRPLERVRTALARYWPALVSTLVLGVAFAVYFTSRVPSLYQPPAADVAGRLAGSMLGRALATGLFGGPWRWDSVNQPAVGADPPGWAVALCWVALVALAAGLALRRVRTGRGWLLLGLYAVAAFVLLFTTRAAAVGEIAGLQYRYLTDVVPVAALCLGLVTMPLAGAVESSAPRAVPLLLVVPSRRLLAVVAAAVLVSGVVSSARYARIWHDDNPGDAYTHTVIASLNGRGPVDLADQAVPDSVIPAFFAPYNTTEDLLPLLVDNARFPDVSSRLGVLDEGGTPHQAVISAATSSPKGPVDGCGWEVSGGPGESVTIPVDTPTYDFTWWVRIGYLASAADTMDVQIADQDLRVPVLRGLNSAYVRVSGSVASVTLGGLSEGNTVCVDTVEVGQPAVGGDL